MSWDMPWDRSQGPCTRGKHSTRAVLLDHGIKYFYVMFTLGITFKQVPKQIILFTFATGAHIAQARHILVL